MSFKEYDRTIIICMTPVVNEAWSLDRFIQCASLWADEILIGYQESIDKTEEVLKKYDNVTIVRNPHKDYHDSGMKACLYDESRKIKAPKKILFNIDADELVSGNFQDSSEWKEIKKLPKGSVIRMPWANLNSDMESYTDGITVHCGFIDDEVSNIREGVMHMIRTPWPSYDIKIFETRELRLVHYNFVNTERMRAKNRWYSAFEKISRNRDGLETWRQYNYYLNSKNNPKQKPIKQEWFTYYQEKGIDVTSIAFSYDYSHDYRLLDYIDHYGAEFFRKCDIWDFNWSAFAENKKDSPERFQDPRNWLDILAYKYALKTLEKFPSPSKTRATRLIDKVFNLIGY